MENSWINIEGELIKVDDTPILLKELNLLPLFLRRFLERNFIKNISPSKEDQIKYYKQFLNREKIWQLLEEISSGQLKDAGTK